MFGLDVNDMRAVLTVLGFLCFLGIAFWAYSKRARKGFDEASLLPFDDDDMPAAKAARQTKEGNKNG